MFKHNVNFLRNKTSLLAGRRVEGYGNEKKRREEIKKLRKEEQGEEKVAKQNNHLLTIINISN